VLGTVRLARIGFKSGHTPVARELADGQSLELVGVVARPMAVGLLVLTRVGSANHLDSVRI
jgi:hypothetical protein